MSEDPDLTHPPRRISVGKRFFFLGVLGAVAVLSFSLGTRFAPGAVAPGAPCPCAADESDTAPPLFRDEAGEPRVSAPVSPDPPPEELPTHRGIDSGLRAQCMLGGEECVEPYGETLTICRRPGCFMEPLGTTPQGFVGPRQRIVDEKLPAGIFRVLALGGSTTGGAPWECGWPGHLERRLRERAALQDIALDFEVLNLGIPTAGTAEILALHRVIGSRFESDAVVLGPELNDMANCAAARTTRDPETGYPQHDVLASYLAGYQRRERLAGLSPWFDRHGEDWARQRSAQRAMRLAEGLREVIAPRAPLPPEAMEQACRDARLDPPDGTPSMLSDYDEGWDYTRRNLEALIGQIAAAGEAEVVLSTSPHAFEAWGCPSPTCILIPTLSDWRSYLTDLHNPSMRRFAAERGLPLVDLERDMAAAAPGESLGEFFAEWMHPRCEGYDLMAERFLELLWPRVTERARREPSRREGPS